MVYVVICGGDGCMCGDGSGGVRGGGDGSSGVRGYMWW